MLVWARRGQPRAESSWIRWQIQGKFGTRELYFCFSRSKDHGLHVELSAGEEWENTWAGARSNSQSRVREHSEEQAAIIA
jgi:hypothetical protein